MTTNIRTCFVGLLLVAGASACSNASSDRPAEHPRNHAQVSGGERAEAHPTASTPDGNLPQEPNGKVPETTRPGRLASDVPGVADPAPPVVPIDPVKGLPAAPDNTAVNERDRDNATLTPGDQGSSERDMAITQRIRETVVDDKSLSFTAKNIKIITLDGRVTLRGPVRNEAERNAIEKAAVAVAGQGQVTNQIEIH